MRLVVLDTNLLVLLAVGNTARRYIALHKRTTAFTEDDYDLLLRTLNNFQRVVVTPNILTETCNLVGQTSEPARSSIVQNLKALIGELEENHEKSLQLSRSAHFIRLGLTDCSILNLLQKNVWLITTDVQLYLTASSISADRVLNFHHLRVHLFT